MSTPPDTRSHPLGIKRLGKYELIARIGVGGMAEVYLARQRGPMNFEKVVVVKSIHPHLSSHKDHVDMLLDEARIAARLKHPNVVDIYDLGVSGEQYFIAMEHLAGQPLLDVMRAGQQGRRMSTSNTVKIIADVASGLHAAHELQDHQGLPLDLVHRDVSPGNIIVLYTGQVKIVDFGIAKARGRVTETGVRRVKGKLGYLSPEQVSDDPVDRRSDIFALGVVLWEALCLRRLFRASSLAATVQAVLTRQVEPPSAHNPDVPPELDAICMRALSRRASQRFATAQEMQQALEGVLADMGGRSEPAAIAAYMEEMFGDQAASRRELLRQVVMATQEIKIEADAEDTEDDFDPPAQGWPQAADPLALPGARLPSRRALYRGAIGAAAALVLVIALAVAFTGGTRDSTASLHAVVADQANTEEVAVEPPASAAEATGDPARDKDDDPDGDPAGDPALDTADDTALDTDDDTALDTADDPDDDTALDPDPALDPAADPADGPAQPPKATAGDAPSSRRTRKQSSRRTKRRTRKSNSRTRTAAARPASAGVTATPATPAPATAATVEPGRDSPRARASTLYREGIQQFVQGRANDALSSFQSALDINPRYAVAYRGMGMVYQQQGRSAQAVSAFRSYLRLSPRAGDRAAIERRIASLGK